MIQGIESKYQKLTLAGGKQVRCIWYESEPDDVFLRNAEEVKVGDVVIKDGVEYYVTKVLPSAIASAPMRITLNRKGGF